MSRLAPGPAEFWAVVTNTELLSDHDPRMSVYRNRHHAEQVAAENPGVREVRRCRVYLMPVDPEGEWAS